MTDMIAMYRPNGATGQAGIAGRPDSPGFPVADIFSGRAPAVPGTDSKGGRQVVIYSQNWLPTPYGFRGQFD